MTKNFDQFFSDFIKEMAEQSPVIRYSSRNGIGLLNKRAYNMDKLDDDDAQELSEELTYGLQQPSGVPNTAIFFFTPEGERKNERLLQLLTKAARFGVVRTVFLASGIPVWKTEDGQVAYMPDQISEYTKESLTVGDVIPGSGDYAPGDNRIPTILGPTLSRKGKVKRKKKRQVKEQVDDSYWQSEACGAFALTMNKLFGFPIIIFKGEGDGEYDETVAHVANLKDGNVIDSQGIRSVEDVKDEYWDVEDLHVEKINADELMNSYMGDDNQLFIPSPQDYQDAEEFILQHITPLIQ